MTARTGMAELILQVRSMANAGTADIVIAGTTYHTDDQIQSTLDRHREQIERETLAIAMDYQNGTPVYTRYQWSEPNVERSTSGSAAWKIQNGAGSVYAGSAGTARRSVANMRRFAYFAASGRETCGCSSSPFRSGPTF